MRANAILLNYEKDTCREASIVFEQGLNKAALSNGLTAMVWVLLSFSIAHMNAPPWLRLCVICLVSLIVIMPMFIGTLAVHWLSWRDPQALGLEFGMDATARMEAMARLCGTVKPAFLAPEILIRMRRAMPVSSEAIKHAAPELLETLKITALNQESHCDRTT